ncbi:hypothetical protein SteCoe_21617 [Stentor coeruleus]|uniref:Peptidase C1A papain C-terminal domain-containing protein n=1 Tax=Stentor coeruleus TaxID=5963 RepID=A0A1R2BP95_9CILI|nr:hypothetical protein SteCoe_21617 [Stentor coeruleus]
MASQGEEVNSDELRKNARKGALKANKKPAASNTTTYVAVGIFGVLVAVVIGLLILNPERPLSLIPALDEEFIKQQNELKLGFTQKANNFFNNWSLADVKSISQIGISQQARNMPPCTTYMNEGELLPPFYDVREKFPFCIKEVQVQGNCSSSNAFATASVASERFCIKSDNKVIINLSPQELVSCNKRNTGCTTGNMDSTWSYVRDSGLVEDYCFPYTSDSSEVADCKKRCDNGISYHVKDVCATASEAGLMREIQNNGPVVALMQLYSDFVGYSSGVYEPHIAAVRVQGAQAVEVMGWGNTEAGVPYWIIKNTWGTTWGIEGYAMVIRGNKDLGLEDLAVTAFPVITEDMVSNVNIQQTEEFEDLDAHEDS